MKRSVNPFGFRYGFCKVLTGVAWVLLSVCSGADDSDPWKLPTNTPSTLHGSGDIGHLQQKVSQREEKYPFLDEKTSMKDFSEVMEEAAFLADGQLYIPLIEEPVGGCAGGSLGRGAGYSFNRGTGIETNTEGCFDGQAFSDQILKMLNPIKLSEMGSVTRPRLWKAKKDGLVGHWMETRVYPFPEAGAAGSAEKFFDDLARDMKAGEPSEVLLDFTGYNTAREAQGKKGFGVDGHVGLGYRLLRFKGYDDLIGLTLADDLHQGDGKPSNYERGPFIFNRKTGACVSHPGARIGSRIHEKVTSKSKMKGTRFIKKGPGR